MIHSVGGEFVEPFAFGSAAPILPLGADEFVMLDPPSRPFTLADAIGASSAFRTSDQEVQAYPHATYWSVGSQTNGQERATNRGMFTDGGDIENYGLISLLQRRLRAIVVFINTVWPLSLEYDSTRWPVDLNDEHATQREIDPFLAPLFGAPSTRFSNNWVFPEADYKVVVSRLQAAKRRGDPVMAGLRFEYAGSITIRSSDGQSDFLTRCSGWFGRASRQRRLGRLPVSRIISRSNKTQGR